MDMDSLEEKLHRERAKLAGMKREMCSNPNFPFFWSAVGEQKKYGKELEKQIQSLYKKVKKNRNQPVDLVFSHK